MFSAVRVVVEHVIAGVKRCRMVKDVVRLTTKGMADQVMEIACGLHNLRVSSRQAQGARGETGGIPCWGEVQDGWVYGGDVRRLYV
jgi:hypothetical protein